MCGVDPFETAARGHFAISRHRIGLPRERCEPYDAQMIDSLGSWHEFNVAMLGAAAALAGLVIVAMSVNIATLISSRTLVGRLASAIAALVLAIAACAAALVPGLDERGYGIVVVVLAVIAAVFPVRAARLLRDETSPLLKARAAKAAVAFLPVAAYLTGGALLALGIDGGMLLVATAALLAVVCSLVVAWVALVEVLR